MAKVFYVRHQAAGVLYEFPFAQPPTDKQVEALRQRCQQLHGTSHRKTPHEPYWVRVQEHALLGPGDVPEVPPPNLTVAGANVAEAPVNTISGTGKVQ